MRVRTIEDANLLDDDAFVAFFGGLFEKSPWVWDWPLRKRPFVDWDIMMNWATLSVRGAGHDQQLALLRAHPKLADKVAQAVMTQESMAEQASAGLDRLTAAEYARFHDLNAAYEEKFGFPFIICVREAGGKAAILDAMEMRLGHTAEAEMDTALAQVDRIAWLRLKDLMHL